MTSKVTQIGNSTFDAARISRFEVTRVAVPRRWRSFHGLGAAFFCVRSSDSAQLSVIRCAAQQSGGFASVRERQVGVAVHGSGVSRGAAQLDFSRRGWCGPPLGS